MADLLITVGTDAANFNRGMHQVAQTAQSTANSVTGSAARINTAITQVGARTQLGANQAGNALTNLGRVAQDAPFGFIGIQNNLNPLLESFQRLRAEAGSNGAALRALTSSLIGPAGIGIALSVISAGILLYQKYMQSSEKATKAAKDANKEYIDAASKDLSGLQVLYQATQNQNLALEDRKKAIDELQSKYPGYFKNLSDEAILVGKANEQYQQLTQAIIGRAAVAAATGRLNEALKPLIDSAISESSVRATMTNKDFKTLVKEAQSELNEHPLVLPIDSFKTGSQITSDIQKPINAGAINFDAQEKSREENLRTVKKWQDTIQQIIKDFGIKSLVDPETQKKDKTLLQQYEDELKRLEDAQAHFIESGGITDFFKPTELERNINSQIAKIDALKEALKGAVAPGRQGGTPMANLVTPLPQTLGTDKGTIEGMQEFAKAAQNAADKLGELHAKQRIANAQMKKGEEIAGYFGQGLTSAFESALSGTQSFVSAMGQFLLQLIEKLVAAALAAAVLAALLTATGFGGATTSFGSLFSSFSGLGSLVPGHAAGGITNGAHLAMVGEGRENEAIIPLSKLDQFVNRDNGFGNGKIIGTLRGADMRLQLIRADKQNSRLS